MTQARSLPRIAVVGCGGLGVPAAWTLALSGARKLCLVDTDHVELSNLHRQVLYDQIDCERPKASALAAALHSRFDHMDIQCLDQRLTQENVEVLLSGCTAAVEGSDDAVAKFALSDWAISGPGELPPRTAVIAAAIGRRGQWMVVEPHGACYRCLFEEPPPAEMLATCAVAGVLGPVVGTVGALAARSLLRSLRGRSDPARSALVRWLPGEIRQTKVTRAADCPCAAALRTLNAIRRGGMGPRLDG